MTAATTLAPVTPLVRRRYGNVVWDGVVRGSGVAALIALAAIHLWPDVAPLAGFVTATIWVNGPVAFLFPATYEPILMLFGRLYPPLLIGTLGIGGTIYVEYLNYELYRKAVHSDALAGFRESRTVGRVTALFARAPFFTVWLCSWSIIPYWPVRVLSPLARFPVTKHLWATFIGRFPRLCLFAALGRIWGVNIGHLFMLTSILVLSAVAVALARVARVSRKTAACVGQETQEGLAGTPLLES